ncbi:hypothetical protein Ddye_013348 [Dipteronia dyeriana]|uniref:Alpha-ketoglutarate-dependent dioxygenase AlkB-like domain-containing protein n=1 Tax=Dipteronia dyeriana TaxID=168575 RepID=A0AAD9X697_9ROSI|nr:hypothetical protein Ddye_013348 [Dipteronia dyeriana]
MQEESLPLLKVETKGQTSEEKGSKNSTSIGDSGHSVQEAGFRPLDLCPPKKGSPFMLKPPLLVKNRQKRNEVKRATEGQIGSELRHGMVLLKNYLSVSDQDRDETPESLKKGLPVVSFSVGNTAEFLYSDERDTENADTVMLESGDVLIFGGKSRHIFHGVKAILRGTTPQALLEETNFRPGRLNLTFKQY